MGLLDDKHKEEPSFQMGLLDDKHEEEPLFFNFENNWLQINVQTNEPTNRRTDPFTEMRGYI